MAHRYEVFVARGGAWYPAELVSAVNVAEPGSAEDYFEDDYFDPTYFE